MKHWLTCVLALVLCGISLGGQEILLNGAMTDRSLFCPGDNITLVCLGTSLSFVFTVGNILTGTGFLVSAGTRTRTSMGFTGNFISNNESRLEFTVPNNFENNTFIECSNPNDGITLANVSLPLYGPPSSAPMITINTNDNLTSFTIGISSNDPATICVAEYNITLTDSNGMSLFATVPVRTSSFTTQSLFGRELELCSRTYSFMIVASSGGPVANMNGQINFQNIPSISAMIVDNNVTVDIPAALENCIFNLTYNFQGQSGLFDVNSDDLMLSMFNTDPCTDGMLRIYPVILGEERTALGASVQLCQPATNPPVTRMSDSSSMSGVTTDDSGSVSIAAGSMVTLFGILAAYMVSSLL